MSLTYLPVLHFVFSPADPPIAELAAPIRTQSPQKTCLLWRKLLLVWFHRPVAA